MELDRAVTRVISKYQAIIIANTKTAYANDENMRDMRLRDIDNYMQKSGLCSINTWTGLQASARQGRISEGVADSLALLLYEDIKLEDDSNV